MFFTRCRAGRKYKGGSVQFVLDARRHNPDHTFVEIRVEYTNRGWRLVTYFKQGLGNHHGLFTHIALDNAAFAVDAIESSGQFIRTRRIIREQAFDAQRHVAQAARSIDAGAQRKAKIKGSGNPCRAAGCYKKAS